MQSLITNETVLSGSGAKVNKLSSCRIRITNSVNESVYELLSDSSEVCLWLAQTSIYAFAVSSMHCIIVGQIFQKANEFS